MINYFYRYWSQYHKGQLAPFFIVLIVVLIIAALVTVNIGKIARTKTYSGNSTDAGALAAASTLAYALNYVATANGKMIQNYNNFNSETQRHFSNAWTSLNQALSYIYQAMSTATSASSSSDWDDVIDYIEDAQDELETFVDEMDLLHDEIVPSYHDFQQDYYELIRERVHDDSDNSNDLYTNALVAGYKLDFLNSGIAVKKGEQGQSDFQSYVDSITISNVTNNTYKTYSWSDGQGRSHSVKAKIDIDALRTYRVKVTQSQYQSVLNSLQSASNSAENAINYLQTAIPYCQIEKILVDCKDSCYYCEVAYYAILAVILNYLNLAISQSNSALNSSQQARNGLQSGSVITSTSKSDTEPYIICWIQDITHDRLVDAYNTQTHQSKTYEAGDGTGQLWEATYPETSSSSRATFNYQGRGKIYPPTASHDAALTTIDFD